MTLLLAALLLTGFAPLPPAPDAVSDTTLHVALVTSAAVAGGTERAAFMRAVREEVRGAFVGTSTLSFAEIHSDDRTPGGMSRVLRETLGAAGVDAAIAIGPQGVLAVREGASFPKPVVAVDPAGGLFGGETPAVAHEAAQNAAVVQAPHTAAADLHTLTQFAPARRVAVLVDAQAAVAYPELHPSVTEAAEALGVTFDAVPVASSVSDALARLPESVDAAYVTPLHGLTAAERGALADGLLARGLPSFVASDPSAVEAGFLAGADRDGRAGLARRAAMRLRELTEAGDSAPLDAGRPMPAPARADGSEAQEERADRLLVVNERVAEALGLALDWEMRLRARFVGEATPDGPVLTLADAMQESILENLSLQIDRYETDAAGENVHLAQSRLLPQVGLETRGRLVSADQAESSLGGQPERLLTGTMTFRQVLFSEPAFANLSVERRRQAARAYELDVARLGAADTAATAYTNVLRARAQEQIQQENLELALTNLEAARTRRRLGEAGPAEVSRLETTTSQARRRVAQAAGRRQAAEIALNQILNRPLDAPVNVHAAQPEGVLERFPYRALLETPMTRHAFKAFWLEEARQQAPEIQATGRLVAAQERQLRSAERSFFLPEVSLEGSFTQRVEESGVGAGVPDVPQNLAGVIQPPPDEQWNVGLTLSFPLFRGTERVAQRQQASERLRAVRTRQDLTARRVEQRTRTAFAQLETAYVETEQARAAAEAAARSLRVVQAAYRRGTASVLDLLDAQSTSLVTQVEAANAAYDFFLRWIQLQRAAGSFEGLRTPEEDARFEERFAPFLDASAAPRRPGFRNDPDAPKPADLR